MRVIAYILRYYEVRVKYVPPPVLIGKPCRVVSYHPKDRDKAISDALEAQEQGQYVELSEIARDGIPLK